MDRQPRTSSATWSKPKLNRLDRLEAKVPPGAAVDFSILSRTLSISVSEGFKKEIEPLEIKLAIRMTHDDSHVKISINIGML